MPTLADVASPASLARLAEAKLTAGAINDLPDSAFAYIEPGGTKDDQGKTTPRSKRHFPIHDKAHTTNALSRASQSPFGTKAMPKIKAAAKKFGIKAAGKESAAPATGSRLPLAESIELIEAKSGGRRYRVRLINTGWGASGHYSQAVLKEAAKQRVFRKGLHSYINHPTATEKDERPERSVLDLAGRLATDAVYESGGLYAEVEVFPHYAPVIDAVKESIGMSIRAYGDGEHGEADGRTGTLITSLEEAVSVDFVTRAGRGGQILELLESARVPAVEGHGMTANDLRDALSTAVKDAHSGEEQYCWVRDYTDDWVVFELSVKDGDGSGLFRQGYTVDADTKVVSLTGDPAEVKVHTEYVPVETPVEASEADQSDAGGEPAGEPAPDAAADDSGADEPAPTGDPPDELAAAGDPPERSSDVPADQAAPDTTPSEGDAEMADDTTAGATEAARSPGNARQLMERELAEARRERDLVKAREQARRVLAEALGDAWIPPATVTRITESLLERLPIDKGVLDETELVKMAGREIERAEREAAEILEAAGMGRPRDLGFGGDTGSQATGLGQAELDKRLETAFADLGLSESVAKRAAKGRG